MTQRERKNNDIRELAKNSGVCLWEIAERIGLSDSNFSRMLRYPLSIEQKGVIISAIHTIAAEVAVEEVQ